MLVTMEAVRESTTAKWEIHYGGINLAQQHDNVDFPLLTHTNTK